jgi:hypothetical protein
LSKVIQKNFEFEGTPEASSLNENDLGTLWRWCENRLPAQASATFDGSRLLADYSSEDRKDLESLNPFVRRLSAITDTFVLDGIMSDGVYWIDDILYWNRDLRNETYLTRVSLMDTFFSNFLGASDLFGRFPSLGIFTQADLELSVDFLSGIGGVTGLSFRGNDYKFVPGESTDWIVVDSVRKLYENEENRLELNRTKPDLELNKILKTDSDKKIVMGVVLEPYTIDAQGDVISKETIEVAAHKFLVDSRTVGFRHEVEAPADVVESSISPIDFEFNGETVRKGSWLIAVKIRDDSLWKSVKEGNINAFSIGGFGVREDLDD